MPLEFVTLTLLMVALVAGVTWLATKSSQRLKQHMGKLAEELGLPLREDEPLLQPASRVSRFLRKSVRVEGDLEGRQIRVTHYVTSSGKSTKTFAAAIAMTDNPHGLRLTVAADNFLSEIGRKLGMQDIATGDPAFDSRFIVKSKDPRFAQAVMLPEIRTLFFKAWDEHAARGVLKLKGNEVRYDEAGSITSGAAVRRFATISRLCVRLADAVEAYSTMPGRQGGTDETEAKK